MMLTAKMTAFLAGVCGLLSVALGAFGAHALKERLSGDSLAIFKTAVEYQFLHALSLLALSAWMFQRPSPWLTASAWAMLAGIVLFCGSLYLLVASGARWWGAVTPLGGLSFLVGWGLVALAAIRG